MKRSFKEDSDQDAAKREELQKRIKELRRRKRREKRRSQNTFIRLMPVLLLIGFFMLCLATSLATCFTGGGSDEYITKELPASNMAEIEDLALEPGQVLYPEIGAAAAFLMDQETGDELYDMNADQALSIASTTKIVTAIVVMENSEPGERVTVSENASAMGESSIWLEEGEALTVEQLLYALLVQSANDAAVALAEHVGGSEEDFVEMMNEKARELGAENTHFSNPHGLDEEGHYSSARDLAYMAAYAMQKPEFRDMVVADGYQIPWPGNPYPRVLENHNRLLQMYPYATGIKTGYTFEAGRCLVASASRDGRELISVVLNSEDYWNQTMVLMDYGFDSFVRVEFAYEGNALARIKVGKFPCREVNAVASSDLAVTARRDRLDKLLEARICCREWLPYPVVGGQETGYIVVARGEQCERKMPLVSDAYRFKPNSFIRFFSFIGDVLGLWWKGIKYIIPGL